MPPNSTVKDSLTCKHGRRGRLLSKKYMVRKQFRSTKRITTKGRREMKMEELDNRAAKMKLKEKEDFSACFIRLLRKISPDLELTTEALIDLNSYLSYAFDRMAGISAIFAFSRNSVTITIKDIEAALPVALPRDLAEGAIYMGRKAVNKFDKLTKYVSEPIPLPFPFCLLSK